MSKFRDHWLGENIREIIFGIQDGAIGNLGVVIGLARAAAANKIILLGGLATMLAQTISMSTGNYLSVKSEKEYFACRGKERAFGKAYAKHKNPLFSSSIMALAVIVGTAIPLLPFFFFPGNSGIYPSIGFTLTALFLTGASKTSITKKSWLRSGLEMLIIGIVSGAAGFAIGTIFSV